MKGKSREILGSLFSKEKTLKELAAEAVFTRQVIRTYPGGVFDIPMGKSPRIFTPAMKGCIWGEPEHITLSLLKTDVFDRRYIRTKPNTLDEVMKGAFSEANKNFDDMPRVGLTRPQYGILLESGGRYNQQAWSDAYPFPCQKAVGQVIIKADDFINAAQPDAVMSMSDGSARVEMKNGEAGLSLEYLMCMKRNAVAVKVKYKNLKKPLSFRLYRHQDQGHRRYMDEHGNYIPQEERVVVFKPVDPQEPVTYYNYEAEADVNSPFGPPVSRADDRFFWIEQVFPADNSFPEGFRYTMMGLVSDPSADITCQDLQKNLGTPPRMPRDSRGNLILPGGVVGHDIQLYDLERSFSYVRNAPGVSGTAVLPQNGSGEAVFYVSVATVNETADYIGRAKQMLIETEHLGFEALKKENKSWYDELYDRRESGRIIVDGGKKEEAGRKLLEDAYLSWSYSHGGYCQPDPSKYEGSAMYAAFDVDTQSWHSLPCYNDDLFAERWLVRNRPEAMLQWPRLVSFWKDALKQKAQDVYGLPGLIMGHGYLPPGKPDPWYIENQALDLCMEVAGQVMKVIWNFWEYPADEEFLRSTAYPLIRELAIFYEAFARRGWDGKHYNIMPTVESESYGISYKLEFAQNTTAAITAFRKILSLAIEGAEYLGCDPELIPGWREVAENLPPYPKFLVGMGEILAGNPGAMPRWTAGDHELNTSVFPATLGDDINLDSPKELRELIIRTADTVRNNHNTEAYILTGAFPEHVPCNYNLPPMLIEDAYILACQLIKVPERLINSRSGRIHLFPVIPKDSVVAFRGFLTRGGFEVSAAKDETGITAVTVKARRSIPCRLMNPWPGKPVSVTSPDGETITYKTDNSNGECLIFDASAGCTYSIDQK